jgi:hypothetical protein
MAQDHHGLWPLNCTIQQEASMKKDIHLGVKCRGPRGQHGGYRLRPKIKAAVLNRRDHFAVRVGF